jgi:hypothetical protein
MKNVIVTLIMLCGLFLGSIVEAQTSASVVRIYSESTEVNEKGKNKWFKGTGFFIGQRIILTNYHVVNPRKNKDTQVYVEMPGKNDWGFVVAEDEIFDLAMVVISQEHSGRIPFKLCNPETIKPGQRVRQISRLENARVRFMKITSLKFPYVFYDRSAEKGSSGAPMVRGYGKNKCVVGITEKSIDLWNQTWGSDVHAIRLLMLKD